MPYLQLRSFLDPNVFGKYSCYFVGFAYGLFGFKEISLCSNKKYGVTSILECYFNKRDNENEIIKNQLSHW